MILLQCIVHVSGDSGHPSPTESVAGKSRSYDLDEAEIPLVILLSLKWIGIPEEVSRFNLQTRRDRKKMKTTRDRSILFAAHIGFVHSGPVVGIARDE